MMTVSATPGWLCLIVVTFVNPSLADDTSPAVRELAQQVQQLDSRVFRNADDQKRLREMLAQDLRRRRTAANERDIAAWRKVQTREDWERLRTAGLEALRRSLGEFPKPPTDLKAQVTGSIAGAGYRIDNLVLETRPGLLVTANLYSPAEPRESMPGILICHSHHNPKSEGELQNMGVVWARCGCIVLVMDQLGHGERRQHPFRSANDFAGEFRPGRQDYYFRYNVGMQLHVVGDSLIGWMTWDLMRGVDLLLGRPGIDRSRIILLGAVAGGGDPAGVTAALDDRIAAVVPFNFGGPQPETTFPLPADAEKTFNYFGGGSWESTRNLRGSVRDGFAPWMIVGSLAPRRLIYAHEFAWDREHDPVWKRLETIFGFYDVATHLAAVNGRGSVRGQSGADNTHCNNIGHVHREGIHAAFERWFQIPIPQREELPKHSVAELTCYAPGIASERPMRPLQQLAAELGSQRTSAARKRLAALSAADRRRQLQDDWGILLGQVEPGPDSRVVSAALARSNETLRGKAESFTLTAERIALQVESDIVVPLVLLRPAGEPRRPVVVGIAQHGKQAFLQQRADDIAELLSSGVAVCLPDLRGTGETRVGDDRGRNSSATNLSSSELMLGQSLLGSRVRDLRAVMRYLRSRSDVDVQRIALWGDSFIEPNARDVQLTVPLDAEQPRLAEPLGGFVVLLAALFEDDIRAVSARGGLVGFHSLLDSPFCHVPHDILVPGALTAGDMSDVAAALTPCPLRIVELVDGQNRLATEQHAAQELNRVCEAYKDSGAEERLVSGQSQLMPDATAKWLHAELNELHEE